MTDQKYIQVEYNASAVLSRFHQSKAFVRVIRGPIGSGKSVGACFELFRLACGQRPNARGVRQTRMVIVRNTLPELKSTTMKTWKAWFPPGDPKKNPGTFGPFSGQPPYTHMVTYAMGDGTTVEMEVIFLALDQPEDAKKLLSLECTAIWYNEAREIHKDHVDAGTGRVGRYPGLKDGGCTRKGILMDTNPPNEEHYLATFEQDPPEGWEFFVQPGGLDEDAENLENLNQPEKWHELTLEERREAGRGYYRDMISGKDPEWVNVYVHNRFGQIVRGVPVYAAGYNKRLHLAPEVLPIRKDTIVQVGIDCSGRHPAAVYLQPTGRGRWQVVRELCVMDDKGMGAERFADYFVEDMKLYFAEAAIDEIWGDPAGNSPSQNDERTYFDILNVALKKYKLRAKPSPGLRFPDRYEAVCWMLSQLVDGQPMLEVSPACKVLAQGFAGNYMFREINTAGGGTRVDDRPVKNRWSNPHDALQYVACGIRVRSGDFRRARSPQKVFTMDASRWKV